MSNDYLIGTMDFSDEDTAMDTKVSYDIYTFGRTVTCKINPIYHWQLDGYMWLFDKKFAKLIYCLLNTPEHLIVKEEKKLLWDFIGSEEDYKEACVELRKKHIFDHILPEEKVVVFNIRRSEERIERIKKRIEDCRIYLENIDTFKSLEEPAELDEAA